MSDISHRWRAAYKALGDKIRGYTGKTDKMTVETAPDEVDLVYAAGVAAGSNSGGGGEAPPSGSSSDNLKRIIEGTSDTMYVEDLEGVTNVIPYAFYYASNLLHVNLPDSIQDVKSYAFGVHSAGTRMYYLHNLPESLVTVGSYAFKGRRISDLTLPNSVTHVYDHAFEGSKADNISLNSGLKSIGANAFRDSLFTGAMYIPNTVESIGDYAFPDNSNTSQEVPIFEEGSDFPLQLGSRFVQLQTCSMTLPARVCYVKSNAINLPNSYAQNEIHFAKTAPFGLALDSFAFEGFKGKSLELPEGTTYIGSQCFSPAISASGTAAMTNGLKYITLPNSLFYIGRRAFEKTTYTTGTNQPLDIYYQIQFNIPDDGCEYLGNPENPYAALICYYYLEGTDLVIPKETRVIGSYAYLRQTGQEKTLTSLTIEEGSKLQGIGDNAFSSASIEEIYLPDSLKALGQQPFYRVTQTSKISLPSTLIRNGWGAGYTDKITGNVKYDLPGDDFTKFQNCKAVGYLFGTSSYTGGVRQSTYEQSSMDSSVLSTSYYVPSTLTSVEVRHGDIASGFFGGLSNLTHAPIPPDCKRIGHYAYYNCGKLTNLEFPDGLEHIGKYAFYGCGIQGDVVLPKSLKSLGEYAFYNSKISSIIVPEGVKLSAAYTFGNCSNLDRIRIERDLYEHGEKLSNYTFSGTFGDTLYVAWGDKELSSQPWGFGGTLLFGTTASTVRRRYALNVSFSFYTPEDVGTLYIRYPDGTVEKYSPDGSDFPTELCADGVVSQSDSYAEEDGTYYIGYYWETATFRFPEVGTYAIWGESANGVKSQKYRIHVEE